jgi:hypothetical protein
MSTETPTPPAAAVDAEHIYVDALGPHIEVHLHALDGRELARFRLSPRRARVLMQLLGMHADTAAQYDANARAAKVVRTLVDVIEATDTFEGRPGKRAELEAAKAWCENQP